MQTDTAVTVGESPFLGRAVTVVGVAGGLCTFHCVYCAEVHARPTTRRRRLADAAELVAAVEAVWDAAAPVDHVVLGGPGDPLLWTGCGDLLRRLHARFKARIAVLTPGPLLSRGTIRAAMGNASLVTVKLDAGSPDLMRSLSRPHRGVHFARHVAALAEFARAFPGRLWLQSALIPGVNDGESDCAALTKAVAAIRPARLLVSGAERSTMDTVFAALEPPRNSILVAPIARGAGVVGSAERGSGAAGPCIPCWQI